MPSFCTRHLHHAKPFIYGPSGNDAKLTLSETRRATKHFSQELFNVGISYRPIKCEPLKSTRRLWLRDEQRRKCYCAAQSSGCDTRRPDEFAVCKDCQRGQNDGDLQEDFANMQALRLKSFQAALFFELIRFLLNFLGLFLVPLGVSRVLRRGFSRTLVVHRRENLPGNVRFIAADRFSLEIGPLVGRLLLCLLYT